MTAPVPVLVLTGPVGVGKSTIAAEAAWLLRRSSGASFISPGR